MVKLTVRELNWWKTCLKLDESKFDRNSCRKLFIYPTPSREKLPERELWVKFHMAHIENDAIYLFIDPNNEFNNCDQNNIVIYKNIKIIWVKVIKLLFSVYVSLLAYRWRGSDLKLIGSINITSRIQLFFLYKKILKNLHFFQRWMQIGRHLNKPSSLARKFCTIRTTLALGLETETVRPFNNNIVFHFVLV